MDRFGTFPRFSISLVFNQPFKIVEIPIDPARDGAAEARSQLQRHARVLVGERRERNDSGCEVIRSAVVGQSSPGESSLRNTQHHLKCRIILLPIETERGDKMIRVQFPDTFYRCDEPWIILKREPALIDRGNRRFNSD